MKVGEAKIYQVLEQTGKPLVFREKGNRSAMRYTNHHQDYYIQLFSEIRSERLTDVI